MEEQHEPKHESCEGTASLIDVHPFKYKGKVFTLRTRDITDEEEATIDAERVRLLEQYAPGAEDVSFLERWVKIPLKERLRYMYMRAMLMLGIGKRLVSGPYGEGWNLTDDLIRNEGEPTGKVIEVSMDNFLLLPANLRNTISVYLADYYTPTFVEAERKNLPGR